MFLPRVADGACLCIPVVSIPGVSLGSEGFVEGDRVVDVRRAIAVLYTIGSRKRNSFLMLLDTLTLVFPVYRYRCYRQKWLWNTSSFQKIVC